MRPPLPLRLAARGSVDKVWQLIRRCWNMADVRIHDLRRTSASYLAISGENLPAIQNVLNHRSLAHTSIYGRLKRSPLIGRSQCRPIGCAPWCRARGAPALVEDLIAAPDTGVVALMRGGAGRVAGIIEGRRLAARKASRC